MFIFEHYVTAWEEDVELKEHYLEDVWEILQKSYKNLGGLLTFKNKEDLLKSNNMWKLVRRPNDVVTAVAIYKTNRGGRKLVAGGSDGSKGGINDFYTICYEDVKMVDRGTWAEVSGPLEGIFLFKYGAVPIPSDVAEVAIKDMRQNILSKDSDGFHYIRNIAGKPLTKIMMGNVPKQYRMSQDWSEEAAEYRHKWSKWNEEHPEDYEGRKKNS